MQLAQRIDLRGENSSWSVAIAPPSDHEQALEALRVNLESILLKPSRILKIRQESFDTLRTQLHTPGDDVVILDVPESSEPSVFRVLDVSRSALERQGPVILWMSLPTTANFVSHAPNIKSFVGSSIYAITDDGSLMTEAQRRQRLDLLRGHFGLRDEEIIRMATEHKLPPQPAFAEWLILIGRGDLL